MNSIQGFGSMQGGMFGMGGMQQQTSSLTDDQKSTVASILSNYDADNITTSSAQEIFQKLLDAGITPQKGLKEAIESAGFDAEQIRSLAMQGTASSQQASELTDDQKSTVASILSNYDADNITAADAKTIFQKFQDAGITPQKGLKEAIEAAGFDAEAIRSLAMPNDNNLETSFWASQNSAQEVSTTALQSLQTILSQYDFTNLSSDQEKNLLSQLNSAGLLQSGNLLNLGA